MRCPRKCSREALAVTADAHRGTFAVARIALTPRQLAHTTASPRVRKAKRGGLDGTPQDGDRTRRSARASGCGCGPDGAASSESTHRLRCCSKEKVCSMAPRPCRTDSNLASTLSKREFRLKLRQFRASSPGARSGLRPLMTLIPFCVLHDAIDEHP